MGGAREGARGAPAPFDCKTSLHILSTLVSSEDIEKKEKEKKVHPLKSDPEKKKGIKSFSRDQIMERFHHFTILISFYLFYTYFIIFFLFNIFIFTIFTFIHFTTFYY